jgi:hypothetical protein
VYTRISVFALNKRPNIVSKETQYRVKRDPKSVLAIQRDDSARARVAVKETYSECRERGRARASEREIIRNYGSLGYFIMIITWTQGKGPGRASAVFPVWVVVLWQRHYLIPETFVARVSPVVLGFKV